MPKVKEIYYTETDICAIDDLKLFDRNATKIDKISLSNRMFTYPTDKGKTRLIFDILKQPTNRINKNSNLPKICNQCNSTCSACFTTHGIANWSSIDIMNINSTILKINEPYYHLEFNLASNIDITFFTENKIININLPCLDQTFEKAKRINQGYDNQIINEIKEPVIKTIEGLKVEFYKFNPIFDAYDAVTNS